MAATARVRGVLRARARRMRSCLVPGYEDLLRDRGDVLRGIGDVSGSVAAAHEGIAELTDVVTELVLPLHDRDIDPARLARLAPDAL